jgi:hypothetical protein
LACHDLYDQTDTIEECYRSWEIFLEKLMLLRTFTRIIEISPINSSESFHQFQLFNVLELRNEPISRQDTRD